MDDRYKYRQSRERTIQSYVENVIVYHGYALPSTLPKENNADRYPCISRHVLYRKMYQTEDGFIDMVGVVFDGNEISEYMYSYKISDGTVEEYNICDVFNNKQFSREHDIRGFIEFLVDNVYILPDSRPVSDNTDDFPDYQSFRYKKIWHSGNHVYIHGVRFLADSKDTEYEYTYMKDTRLIDEVLCSPEKLEKVVQLPLEDLFFMSDEEFKTNYS